MMDDGELANHDNCVWFCWTATPQQSDGLGDGEGGGSGGGNDGGSDSGSGGGDGGGGSGGSDSRRDGCDVESTIVYRDSALLAVRSYRPSSLT